MWTRLIDSKEHDSIPNRLYLVKRFYKKPCPGGNYDTIPKLVIAVFEELNDDRL